MIEIFVSSSTADTWDIVFSVQCFHAEQIGCELERCAQEINKVFLFVVICGSAACTTANVNILSNLPHSQHLHCEY